MCSEVNLVLHTSTVCTEFTTHILADSYVLYIIAMHVHTPASSYFTSQYSLYMADISLMPSVVITHIRVIILLVYILVMCSVAISVLLSVTRDHRVLYTYTSGTHYYPCV